MEKRLLKKVRKEMVKICLLMVLILLSTNRVSAKMKEHVDEELYNQACDKALEVIRPLNVENKEVNIRDCYVVLNMSGEFDGYSLGYFVDEKPYGYAIYSAENNSVREFVFCPDVENMYKKIRRKSKTI